MSAVINPYAPPAAAVLDVYAQGGDVGYQPVKLFSAQGRIGRARLITYMTAGFGLYVIAAGLLAAAIFFGAQTSGVVAFSVACVLLLIPLYIFAVLCQIQRSHDMDWSGWTVLLTYIPFVGGLIGLLWLFIGGTPGINRFGAPPPPNPLSVKIVGLWLPLAGLVLMVVGIVVGIVVAGIAATSSPEFMQGIKDGIAEGITAQHRKPAP